MHRKTLVAHLGAIVMALAASGVALAASSGPAVTVQVKNGTKTLTQRTVHGETGWITKDGTPKGKCSASGALGALDAATRGKWVGKYDSSLGGLFVTSIDGVKPKNTSYYWAFYVNGKYSNVGACAVKLKPGEKLLFKIAKG
jgi:uncharacterized low-complexity protein